jgi:hypothetical protein
MMPGTRTRSFCFISIDVFRIKDSGKGIKRTKREGSVDSPQRRKSG